MRHILVLDIGSSSTRAMLFDEQANLVPGAVARRAFDFTAGADGRSEDDPEQAVLRVVDVLDELHPKLAAAGIEVSAAGVSAYASSLLCLDAHGVPLTPAFTYADTRSAQDARELRGQFDELAVLQRTGCRIRANYLPSRIAWIKRTMPDIARRTRWFVSLGDYLALRLFGQMRGGISVWSWSGLLDRQTGDWDRDWLRNLILAEDQLPVIAQQGEWLAGLRPEYMARWPQLRNLRLLPPVGDGAAANVGSGCVDDRHIAVTIGSTAAMRIVRGAALQAGTGAVSTIPAGLWSYRVDHTRALVGGATTEGGNVFAWLRRTLDLPGAQVLEDTVRQMEPDAHGLTILPLFAGERSPGYSENSRATLHGLTLDSDPTAIARACLEAIAYRLALIYDDLHYVADPNATLIASGGALLASPTWCQIIADVTGIPLQVCAETEATSRGMALLVLERTNHSDKPGLNEPALTPMGRARLGAEFTPDSRRHDIYRAAMARQQMLYAKLV